MKAIPAAALLVAVSTFGACQNSDTAAPSLQQVVVEPPATTDTFVGTVPVKGSDSHQFTISQAGTVSITLTAAGPPPTITMGLGIGAGSTTDSTVCNLLQTGVVPTAAGTTPQITGTVSQTGPYCVEVFDANLITGFAGTQTDAVNYTVTVTHPK
jgi:hypothetical protein